MIQIVLLFLVVVMLLGVGGKWLRLPPRKRRPEVEAASRCLVCKTYVVGKTPAPCARADCPYRPAA
jgi:hypothetical protein